MDPGLSRKTICPASRWIPAIRSRVVCGFRVTIATLARTIRLSKVDFPTLGRPNRATNPDFGFTGSPRRRPGETISLSPPRPSPPPCVTFRFPGRRLPLHPDFHPEEPNVRRPVGGEERVCRKWQMLPLAPLLQPRLRVEPVDQRAHQVRKPEMAPRTNRRAASCPPSRKIAPMTASTASPPSSG